MKKILLFFLVIITTSGYSQNSKYQFYTQGLVSQLLEIKIGCENHLYNTFQSNASEEVKKTTLDNYNEIRLLIDLTIYQMIAEMKAKNSARLFRKINHDYQNHELEDIVRVKSRRMQFNSSLLRVGKLYKDNVASSPLVHIINWDEFNSSVPYHQPNVTFSDNVGVTKSRRVDGIIHLLENIRLVPPQVIVGPSK